MPMKMGWRWYGEGNDPVTLSDIKQIPGVTSIVWALHNKMPGEIWEIDEIQKVADQIHAYGFDMDVVESVNVHDDIKIGLPTRDQYIENYKQCIRNLSKFGVKVICYNFMPIFDWTRTDLFHPVGDGSTALFYEKDKIKGDYKAMAEYIMSFTEKYNMTFPGWEPERMAKLDELFKAYAPVTKEKLWENLKYFLEALMPTCHECDIKMAIHMDDPPWDIFGLPRLLVDEPSIDRFLKMVDDPYNCLTLCTGSLNANPYIIALLIDLILLVLGMIMDMAPIILIATPILLPIATSIGIDPIQFGIIVVLNCGIGLLTPPVGSVLFIGSAVAKRPMEKVVKATLPFYLCMFIALLLLTYIPDISLAIPKLLGGYVSPIANPLGPVFIH